jgi:hypothetical protein
MIPGEMEGDQVEREEQWQPVEYEPEELRAASHVPSVGVRRLLP